MKIFLIVIGVIAIGCVALELGSRLVAKRSRERFDKMSPEEQRKYQEEMYKLQQLARASICVASVVRQIFLRDSSPTNDI